MSVPLVPVLLVLWMPALFVAAYLIDWLRFGERPDSELVDALVIAHRRLSPDDAPRWAEVLGVVLAVGLTARSGCHVLAARVAGLEPELADHDVTGRSPVVAVREGDWQVDASARMLSVCVAVLAWTVLEVSLASWAGAFVAAQLGVLAVDPIAWLAHRTQTTVMEAHTHG